MVIEGPPEIGSGALGEFEETREVIGSFAQAMEVGGHDRHLDPWVGMHQDAACSRSASAKSVRPSWMWVRARPRNASGSSGSRRNAIDHSRIASLYWPMATSAEALRA